MRGNKRIRTKQDPQHPLEAVPLRHVSYALPGNGSDKGIFAQMMVGFLIAELQDIEDDHGDLQAALNPGCMTKFWGCASLVSVFGPRGVFPWHRQAKPLLSCEVRQPRRDYKAASSHPYNLPATSCPSAFSYSTRPEFYLRQLEHALLDTQITEPPYRLACQSLSDVCQHHLMKRFTARFQSTISGRLPSSVSRRRWLVLSGPS